ncbi:hypothetical protein H7X46_22840 [Pseudonocardia sp. C8]|uniref:hypothetical protein n=1 Tax=Pseudonocardia sp. C8 TaxID=2762759 RepID=UPI001642B283|nr:hypothetical protein [Pseudonocardia sp. C8]MBC3193902.1 hypothetical protein [Pseudonocardia sp. C8]
MAGDQDDHLAEAGEAVRLSDLAIRQSAEGRREQALAAAEGAARLYRALAEGFPVMFGPDAERADALAAAIREDRPIASTPEPTTSRQCAPADQITTAGVPASHTARVPDGPAAVSAPEPEPPTPPVLTTRRTGRSRRRTVLSAVVSAVLLVPVGMAGWAFSRPPTPTPVPVQAQAPPAAVPATPTWTATARIDVAPTGVTLRSVPSTAGAPVGRLQAGAVVRIQCGEIGRMTSTDAGERSSTWLRVAAGSYLAAVNVEVRGSRPVTNCIPGQPPAPIPHHR